MNFNNQHCVELLTVIFSQVWLSYLKIHTDSTNVILRTLSTLVWKLLEAKKLLHCLEFNKAKKQNVYEIISLDNSTFLSLKIVVFKSWCQERNITTPLHITLVSGAYSDVSVSGHTSEQSIANYRSRPSASQLRIDSCKLNFTRSFALKRTGTFASEGKVMCLF